jgi:hypothetical protein
MVRVQMSLVHVRKNAPGTSIGVHPAAESHVRVLSRRLHVMIRKRAKVSYGSICRSCRVFSLFLSLFLLLLSLSLLAFAGKIQMEGYLQKECAVSVPYFNKQQKKTVQRKRHEWKERYFQLGAHSLRYYDVPSGASGSMRSHKQQELDSAKLDGVINLSDITALSTMHDNGTCLVIYVSRCICRSSY